MCAASDAHRPLGVAHRSPGRNLFRFMSDSGRAGSPAESPFLRSPIGGDAALDAPGVTRKPARKIARSPFKARALARHGATHHT
jgi:hypothetical protein